VLFEIGRIHFREQESVKEMSCAGILLSGLCRPHHFDRKPADFDFFDLKGVVENLCDELQLPLYQFEPSHLHTLHPWRQAKIQVGGVTIGVLGEIHPELLLKFDISVPLYFAELNLNDTLPLKKNPSLYSQLPLFPASVWDWTITLKQSVPFQTVLQTITQEKSPLLEDFYLFDLYKSETLGIDHYNATFRFVYRDCTKTLEDETVKREHEKITQSVAKNLQNHI
jgi:phenylalanyl-tRNA synthetase beta chain